MSLRKLSELCTFCTETKECLVHIFGECNHVQNSWLAIGNFLTICGVISPFHAKDICLGPNKHSSAQDMYKSIMFNCFEILYMHYRKTKRHIHLFLDRVLGGNKYHVFG